MLWMDLPFNGGKISIEKRVLLDWLSFCVNFIQGDKRLFYRPAN
jgi:hypothetical protein